MTGTQATATLARSAAAVRPLRIAYTLTEHDGGYGPHDLIPRELEKLGNHVDWITRLPQRYPWRVALRIKSYSYTNIVKRKYTRNRDTMLVKDYGRQISGRLGRMDADVVLSPLSLGSQPIAYVKTNKPIAIWTDTTFAGALNFYPEFSTGFLCGETVRDGLANERSAMQRLALAIYTSDWAANIAMDRYNLHPSKVKVVSFGPCLNYTPSFTEADVSAAIPGRLNDRCRLLFIGKNWKRKGGNIALDVAKRLHARGVPVELTLAGSSPPLDEALPSYVKSLGYIDKSAPEGLAQIGNLFLNSTFFLLPSIADCVPNVVLEALAYGLPSVAARVGGMQAAVRDGVTGMTVPHGPDSVDRYCDFIERSFSDQQAYRSMALAGLRESASRLNWDFAARQVTQYLNQLV